MNYQFDIFWSIIKINSNAMRSYGSLQSSLRINDIFRLLNILELDVMGTHYRATLPTGKLINLAVAIQGQNILRLPALESIAHREIGVNPLELNKVYLPILQEWGFVRIFEKKLRRIFRVEVICFNSVQNFGKMVIHILWKN